MPRGSRLATILFWLMSLTGGVMLAASLLLPPWLEYQAQLAEMAVRERQLAQLEARLAAARKQIEHWHNDPAYVERLYQQEFGTTPPGETTILIEPGAEDATPSDVPAAGAELPPVDEQVFPEMSAFFERVVVRYPLTHVFVHERMRPIVMAMGAVLLASAVLLLGRSPGAKRPRSHSR